MVQESLKCSIQLCIAKILIRPENGPDPNITFATRPGPVQTHTTSWPANVPRHICSQTLS